MGKKLAGTPPVSPVPGAVPSGGIAGGIAASMAAGLGAAAGLAAGMNPFLSGSTEDQDDIETVRADEDIIQVGEIQRTLLITSKSFIGVIL